MLQQLKKYFSDDRPLLMVRLLVITWIITKFICYPLWLGDRLFPMVPVDEILLQLPAYVHLILLWSSFILMLLFVVSPKRKWALGIVLLELLSCLLDQNRWQPWEYQFIFMLATYAIYLSPKHLFIAWQIILVGLYFFSGLGKLNAAFIHDIWVNLILHSWLGIFTNNVFIFRLGYALPLLEMAAVLMLCFARFRKMGVLILCGMHLFILVIFGPAGLNWNEVIWPWNILMPIVLFVGFFSHSFLAERSFFAKPFSWLLITCFFILPWLQLVNRWDHYLSFTLYSGGIPQLYICTDDPAALQKMSVYMGATKNGMIPCRYPVSAYQWGIATMQTAPYPQAKVYKSIAKQWKKQFPNAAVKFYVFTSGFSPKVEEMIVE